MCGSAIPDRRAAARDDYTRRLIRWMEHFVLQGNSELPDWELELPADADEE